MPTVIGGPPFILFNHLVWEKMHDVTAVLYETEDAYVYHVCLTAAIHAKKICVLAF